MLPRSFQLITYINLSHEFIYLNVKFGSSMTSAGIRVPNPNVKAILS